MNPLLELTETTPNNVDSNPVLPDWWIHGLPAELVAFYQRYVSGAGWIGESYINVLSSQEIPSLNARALEFDDPDWENYLFFATNGGGECFGLSFENDQFIYVVAPQITIDIDDVLVIGPVEEFFAKLNDGTFLN